MSTLDALSACAGSWRGTSTLQDPGTIQPDTSPSDLTVTPVLGGRFVRLDYTWSYQGKPQEGSLLIGFDKGADTVTAHWIDSFHMSNKVMACTGPRPEGRTLSVRGSYAAPPGPDWANRHHARGRGDAAHGDVQRLAREPGRAGGPGGRSVLHAGVQ